ncbi:uncharacterized protein zbbx isoform 2-T3 [Menidia menidia]
MNLNDFVVLPSNKTVSVKLNARNMQDLQMDTLALGNESMAMEEKLQQLKDNMSKEKEERGHSRVFRWTSRKCLSSKGSSLSNNFKTNNIEKLSAGKLKIRLLKDEPLTAPSKPTPPCKVPAVGAGIGRRSRLKGVICGQCEVMTAGLANLQTHVSTQDIVNFVQRQIDDGSSRSTFKPSFLVSTNSNTTISSNTRREDESPEKATEVQEKLSELDPDCRQILVRGHGDEKNVGLTEDHLGEFPFNFQSGQHNKESSSGHSEEDLKIWRGEKSHKEEQNLSQALWTHAKSVSVSEMATQADLTMNREAERRRKGTDERITVKVEFTKNNLTYLDRLLLKKHRRISVGSDHSSHGSGPDLKSLNAMDTKEEITSNLSAEEEDFHRYCTSLFEIPLWRNWTEPQSATPESCLVIEVLDETCRDMEVICDVEQKAVSNRGIPAVQKSSWRELTPVSQTALASSRFSTAVKSSPSSKPSILSGTPVQLKSAKKLHSSKCQTLQPEHSIKEMSSKNKAPSSPIVESPATSKTKKFLSATASQSSMSIISPTVNESRSISGTAPVQSLLPHSQSEIPKSLHSPRLCLSDASPLDGEWSANLQEYPSWSPSLSITLRSTFTVSPSSSTEFTFLPKVYHKDMLENNQDSSHRSRLPQCPKLLGEPVFSQSSFKAPTGIRMSSQQSQHSMWASKFPLLENQFPPENSVKPVLSQVSPVPYAVSPYSRSWPALKNDEAPVFLPSTPIPDDQRSTRSHQDTKRVSSSLRNVFQNPLKLDEDEELSTDSEEEMSSDSLGLAPENSDSSDDKAQTQGHLWSEKLDVLHPALSHLEDFFGPSDAETEKQTNELHQQSESFRVLQKQSAGSESEQFCDLDGLSPLGLDADTGHLNSSAHVRCEQLHTCQFSVHDSDPTESCNSSCCEDLQLVFRTMEDSETQPMGIDFLSTRSGEISEFCLPRRPFSQATQEIMEICKVDEMGCEDPDVDMDTTAHMLQGLEQELKDMSKENLDLVLDMGDGENDSGRHHFMKLGVSEEQKAEEEAAERDRQSVLLLP